VLVFLIAATVRWHREGIESDCPLTDVSGLTDSQFKKVRIITLPYEIMKVITQGRLQKKDKPLHRFTLLIDKKNISIYAIRGCKI
jgi:hypothetical protein